MKLHSVIWLSILGMYLGGCTQKEKTEKNDLSATELKGKVGSIVTSYYVANENFEGKVIFGERMATDTQTYNEDGYLLSNIHNYTGPEMGKDQTVAQMVFTVSTKLTRVLNSKNKILEETEEKKYQDLSTNRTVYEYHADDVTPKRKTVTKNFYTKTKCDTIFDKLGNPIEAYQYSYSFWNKDESTLSSKASFRYIYKGDKIKDKYTTNSFYDTTDNVKDSTVFVITENNIFDSFDNIIEYKKTIDTLQYSKNISEHEYRSVELIPIRIVKKYDKEGKEIISEVGCPI